MRNTDAWQEARVAALRDLSPTVREFTLEPHATTQPLPHWSPGSHLPVQVTIDGAPARRTYSLIGAPDTRHCRIAVKLADPGRGGSRFMWQLREGDALPVAAPLNDFEIGFGAPETLLVAGGIGVTPLVGMAQTLASRRAPVRMLYAAREAAEWVYADTLRDALGERLHLLADERDERIDFDAEIAALGAGAQLVICGPLPMLEAARAAWRRAQRPAPLLRFETFGNTGALASGAFRVELPRHGLTIDVPPSRTLLEALEDRGIETLSNCRRGECGTCTLDVLAVEGRIDHRDVFFSDVEKHEGRRLCACVSRVSEGGHLVLDTAYRPDA